MAGDLDSKLAQALLPLPASEPLQGALQAGPVLEILFSGDSAKEPVLTGVARHFDIDLNVLAGSVETLGGQQFGHLRVQLAEDADYDAVLRLPPPARNQARSWPSHRQPSDLGDAARNLTSPPRREGPQ